MSFGWEECCSGETGFIKIKWPLNLIYSLCINTVSRRSLLTREGELPDFQFSVKCFFLVEANTNTLELLLCGCISPNLFLAFFPRLFQLLLLRLHGWEGENLLDVVGVGEEHGHPANDPWIDIPNQCKISSKNIASSSKAR